jgi:hypothetical protein
VRLKVGVEGLYGSVIKFKSKDYGIIILQINEAQLVRDDNLAKKGRGQGSESQLTL